MVLMIEDVTFSASAPACVIALPSDLPQSNIGTTAFRCAGRTISGAGESKKRTGAWPEAPTPVGPARTARGKAPQSGVGCSGAAPVYLKTTPFRVRVQSPEAP